MDLWHKYNIFVKNGNTAIGELPPVYIDVAEAELSAQAEMRRIQRRKEEAAELAKSFGLTK